ncbi:DUF222 domain-containing protein [Prauserella oleivorans]|uniref:HNH endonuclease signature motif containing protein n=1 Tax=Prauserella oleivorans TaxID=1478153 RepID=UPI003625EA71
MELRHGDDAMATLTADLPAEVASAAYARIDRCARAFRNAGDGRTMDQLRADVFADLLLSGPSGEASVRAEVFIHIDVATLIGLAENPAELAGHGPLPAPIARAIAFDPNSTWRRIITDPHTGAPVDVGRTRYRPPAVTADHVTIRDRECRFPTCHRPAHFVDLDHVIPRQRSGDTNTDNLIGLCRRHHRTKHTPGWRFHLTDTGDAEHHHTHRPHLPVLTRTSWRNRAARPPAMTCRSTGEAPRPAGDRTGLPTARDRNASTLPRAQGRLPERSVPVTADRLAGWWTSSSPDRP